MTQENTHVTVGQTKRQRTSPSKVSLWLQCFLRFITFLIPSFLLVPFASPSIIFFCLFFFLISTAARDIRVVRPIYGVELFDGETARFEVEISEDDVHGQWKLNGEVLSPSSVRTNKQTNISSPG